MSLDKQLWMGKARYTHKTKQGPEMENYNNLAMFRYNAYFGVHTAYYMDLVSQSGRMALPMGNVIFAAIKTILARTLAKKNSEPKVLNPWIHGLFNKLDNLKFISYVDADGFPVVLLSSQPRHWTPTGLCLHWEHSAKNCEISRPVCAWPYMACPSPWKRY